MFKSLVIAHKSRREHIFNNKQLIISDNFYLQTNITLVSIRILYRHTRIYAVRLIVVQTISD